METDIRGWCIKDNILLFLELKDNVITISILRCYDDRPGRIKSIVLPIDLSINTDHLQHGLNHKKGRTFDSVFQVNYDEFESERINQIMLDRGEIMHFKANNHNKN